MSEFEAEVEESESATLQQYYREAMIQGYNFAFEVRGQRSNRSKIQEAHVDESRRHTCPSHSLVALHSCSKVVRIFNVTWI